MSLAFVVLLAVPLFGDPRTIYAGAFISGQSGSFPENISYPFYMRGFGYKCLYYGLYRAADLVVDSRSTFAFELVTRLIYYSGFMALAAWFFWLLRERLAPAWEFTGWKRCSSSWWPSWPLRTISISNRKSWRCC